MLLVTAVLRITGQKVKLRTGFRFLYCVYYLKNSHSIEIKKESRLKKLYIFFRGFRSLYLCQQIFRNSFWKPLKLKLKMRLWTQAIHMGKYVARSVVSAITGDECELDFAFMHFMHATHFFGFRKVIDQKS